MNREPIGSKTQAQLATLETKVDILERETSILRKVVHEQRKINWLVIIGAISLTVTIVSLISQAIIAPLQIEIEHLKGML